MSWRLKHPEWFENEKNELETHKYYSQKYSEYHKSFVSCGEIIIRQKQITRYPVLIVYPESSPYHPPKIYILKKILSEEEVKKISTNPNSISEVLHDNTNFLYLRHQMSDGTVCFIESDDLYNDSPEIFNISDILTRIHDWIKSINSGVIPNDTIEVDYYSHFPNKTVNKILLLPEVFYTNQITQGEFYAYKHPVSTSIDVFLGTQLIGQNKSGVSQLPLSDEMFSRVTGTKQENIIKTLASPDIVDKEIKSQKLLMGSWWDINLEPRPFKDSTDIIKIINPDEQLALNLIYKSNLFIQLKNYQSSIHIGLRFLNRKQELEWILFQLDKKRSEAINIPAAMNDITSLLKNYDISAIKSKQFSEYFYHQRNGKSAERIALKEKSISIIGCGALGSEIADCLGKAGFGSLTLIDNQFIEPNNPIRHVLGLESLYFPKSEYMSLKINLHNPFVYVRHLIKDLNFIKLSALMDDDSIGISSIADNNLESYLNEQAVANNTPLFYSRVLRGGKVARIFRVVPGKDACFRCLLQYKIEGNPLFVDIPEDEENKTIRNECNNPIRPASAADIKLAASVTSRILIEYCQTSSQAYNHWIFYSESLDKLILESGEFMKVQCSFIAPHPDCPICGVKEKLKVRITKEALNFMKSEIDSTNDIETGGVLIGYVGANNCVYVCRASGPGPKAIKERSIFERDIEYCQSVLNEEYEKYRYKGIYIGEWHYHPFGSNRPSRIDLNSLSEISESENYLTSKPVMIIISKEGDISVSVHPAGKKYYFIDYEITDKDREEL